MKFFEEFVSDCAAGSANQTVFAAPDPQISLTLRTFYKITFGGRRKYSLLFSNILDSTFGDGTQSHRNQVLDEWEILEAKALRCRDCSVEEMPEDSEFIGEAVSLTFGGKSEKTAAPGEFFTTDPAEMVFDSGDFLCVEMKISGKAFPSHAETLLPVFTLVDGKWEPTVHAPMVGMVGCDRRVKKRIGFLGDSITQGIGTPKNSYLHCAALIAEKLGEDYACWDLGIGYARGNDAATDGAWLFKAKQNDVVTVCFGVNDMFQGFTADEVKLSLRKIVNSLRKEGIKVIIQTVPPFDYAGIHIEMWNDINEFIRNELAGEADGFLDVTEFLSRSDEPNMSRFGGHPNAEGNALWAEALSAEIKKLL